MSRDMRKKTYNNSGNSAFTINTETDNSNLHICNHMKTQLTVKLKQIKKKG